MTHRQARKRIVLTHNTNMLPTFAPTHSHTSTRATQTTLLVALALTGCRNPGIVRRWPEKPPNCDHWYWSDQVGTFRPPKSQYDGDCGLIIEEFDHTCPWCVLFDANLLTSAMLTLLTKPAPPILLVSRNHDAGPAPDPLIPRPIPAS